MNFEKRRGKEKTDSKRSGESVVVTVVVVVVAVVIMTSLLLDWPVHLALLVHWLHPIAGRQQQVRTQRWVFVRMPPTVRTETCGAGREKFVRSGPTSSESRRRRGKLEAVRQTRFGDGRSRIAGPPGEEVRVVGQSVRHQGQGKSDPLERKISLPMDQFQLVETLLFRQSLKFRVAIRQHLMHFQDYLLRFRVLRIVATSRLDLFHQDR